MASPRVLLSGDYWHADYRDLIARMSLPATLTPLDKLDPGDVSRFSIVIIAQSRSNQFDQAIIDSILAQNPLTPVVMLLGSWCEGERRSDRPVEGVKRVLWHQWQGRFANFCQQMEADGITIWHSPATESDADRILSMKNDGGLKEDLVIGISALNQPTYDALARGIEAIGGRPKWVERMSWINLAASVSAICIDGDSLDATLQRRIRWLQSKVDHAPLIALLNFPRRQEIEQLTQAGVADVVSKPFELADLKAAIDRSFRALATSSKLTRGPSFVKRRTSTETVE